MVENVIYHNVSNFSNSNPEETINELLDNSKEKFKNFKSFEDITENHLGLINYWYNHNNENITTNKIPGKFCKNILNKVLSNTPLTFFEIRSCLLQINTVEQQNIKTPQLKKVKEMVKTEPKETRR